MADIITELEAMRKADRYAEKRDADGLREIATNSGHGELVRTYAGRGLIGVLLFDGDNLDVTELMGIASERDFTLTTRNEAGAKLIRLYAYSRMDIDVHGMEWIATARHCTSTVRDAAGAKLIELYASSRDVSGRMDGLKSIAENEGFTALTRQTALNRLDALQLAKNHAGDSRKIGKSPDRKAAAVRSSNCA